MEKTEIVIVKRASNPARKVFGRTKAKGHTSIPQECIRIIWRARLDASKDR